MDDVVWSSSARARFAMWLLGVFAGSALLLSLVERRRLEIVVPRVDG